MFARLIVALLLCLTACLGEVRDPGRFPVGVTTASLLTNPNSPALIVEVWYPATEGTVEVPQVYGGGYRGVAARDAALRDTSRYPLVLLSHGLRGGRYDLSWVAEALAAEGVVAMAVQHIGSDDATYDEREAEKLWVRADTLSRALDGMLQSNPFGKVIEPRHIAAVGHSLGGSTVLLLAGAHLDGSLFRSYFPEVDTVDTDGRYDRRVRGVVALAPGTGPAFVQEGVARVQVPALIYSGSADWHTPEADNAGFFAKHIAHAQWHSLPHVSHYTFEPECTLYGRFRVRKLCNDKWQVQRHAVHETVVDGIRAFLARVWVD